MSTKIVPSFRGFIQDILQEDFTRILPKHLNEEIDRLDRAIIEGHTLKTQQRLDYHRVLRFLLTPPADYGASRLGDLFKE